MNFVNALLIFLWILLLIVAAISFITKATYHFSYLKKVYPKKFSSVNNYFEYTLKPWSADYYFSFNIHLPYFRAEKNEPNDKEVGKLKRKIKTSLKFQHASLALIAFYTLLAIVLDAIK